MPLSRLPALLASVFLDLAHGLDRRSAARLPLLLVGILFAKGRRTVTAWFRAAGIAAFRPAYTTVRAVGREASHMALSVQAAVAPLLDAKRLLVALDDTPTPRYGRRVEGAGVHHNPSPGPAGGKYVYGHVWVTLAALAKHPAWGAIALPLQAQLYIRDADLENLPPGRTRPFQTKLELVDRHRRVDGRVTSSRQGKSCPAVRQLNGDAPLAAGQLHWLKPWVDGCFQERWAAVDGGYAKAPFLRPAQKDGFVVVSRLRKDAHLCDLPPTERRPGQRGPLPTYGKKRISLAKRAGQTRGWQQVACVQYGAKVTKTIKTFLATWRPAGGVIRVVLVQKPDGWLAFFCTKPGATPEEVLEAAADRGALEQTNKDVKEVWGAGQQQVRNLNSNEGCFNLNLWLYSLVEAWAWNKPEEQLVDRSACPWDSTARRPSHQDKRKALRREVLQGEIQEALSGQPNKERIRQLAQCLLDLAA